VPARFGGAAHAAEELLLIGPRLGGTLGKHAADVFKKLA